MPDGRVVKKKQAQIERQVEQQKAAKKAEIVEAHKQQLISERTNNVALMGIGFLALAALMLVSKPKKVEKKDEAKQEPTPQQKQEQKEPEKEAIAVTAA